MKRDDFGNPIFPKLETERQIKARIRTLTGQLSRAAIGARKAPSDASEAKWWAKFRDIRSELEHWDLELRRMNPSAPKTEADWFGDKS